MVKTGNVSNAIANAEHIGPSDTGDNIEAKRVAGYVWNGSSWERSVSPTTGKLVPFSYDYIEYEATDTTTDTYTYKTGGSSGTTVATVTIVYTDDTKEQVSTVTRT